jgi:hypothetical protein
MATGRTPSLRCRALTLVTAWLIGAALPAGADAELRISHLSVFVNDADVTVRVVLLGALPDGVLERLHSGFPTHVRLDVELWQHNRFLADRRLQTRSIERQITYDLLTREYKVLSLAGEQREPYLTKDLRDAQRAVSEVRVVNLAPAGSLSPRGLYYVRVRSDVTQGGVNSWLARLTGDAEETAWLQSTLLTVTRSQ